MDTMEIIQILLTVMILIALVVLILRKQNSKESFDPQTYLASVEKIESRMKTDFSSFRGENQEQNGLLRKEVTSLFAELSKILHDQKNSTQKEIEALRTQIQESLAQGRKEQADHLHHLMAQNKQSITELKNEIESRFEKTTKTIDEQLDKVRGENAQKLEEMRLTVDEKLQGTLEKRLGESFKQVGDRLEAVHKGLGEMQQLANGVGDLKKVLTNVKSRGVWGEMQLEILLEQVLNPTQYEKNFAPHKTSSERVEFAIKLPGQSEDQEDFVYLPIDAKFPMEDYQRLLDAQELGDIEQIEKSSKALETRIQAEAKSIQSKYLNPPVTTDFGILYLPTEGLFAEVMKRPALSDLKEKYKVVIAGPTTLWSILNSLQMGFRTLAIQKRSSEVWNTLSAVKTEWSKYGEVLDKVQKKLGEASSSIDAVKTRSNVIGKKLRTIQGMPEDDAMQKLGLDPVILVEGE